MKLFTVLFDYMFNKLYPKPKLVYVGAGEDMCFENIQESNFEAHLIDSMPQSQYGKSKDPNDEVEPGICYPLFLKTIKDKFYKNGYILVSDENPIHFRKEDKDVFYHYSTSFPEDYKLLKPYIKDFDILYVSGFLPNRYIMTLAKHKIKFYGSSSTVYLSKCYENRDERNDVDLYLNEKQHRVTSWNKMIYNWSDKVEDYEFQGIEMYERFDDFVKKSEWI
jgi:hypothetical protein